MKWRLINDSAHRGAWNMAVDEAILLHAADASTHIAPTLRFYGWNPPCLSLGRFQKWDEIIQGEPQFDVVRRPTGGRAVWHQHEITYCAVFPEHILPPDATSVVGSYAWLSRGFLAGLEILGVQAQIAPAGSDHLQTRNCFETATRADFVVDGRKLIGAAQRRFGGAILQHGSLLLDVDEDAWQKTVGSSANVVTLKQLGVYASTQDIVEALCRGCENAWNIELTSCELSSLEISLAERLHKSKYSQHFWTHQARDSPLSANDLLALNENFGKS
jgi:lipoyl(octanoyl) transferase